jgi:hypothetical protein
VTINIDQVRADHPDRRITATAATVLASPERDADGPDPTRTPLSRVLAANTAGWKYWTPPDLAARAHAYLNQRRIDLTALPACTTTPLVGHTSTSKTGLVDHLRSESRGPPKRALRPSLGGDTRH